MGELKSLQAELNVDELFQIYWKTINGDKKVLLDWYCKADTESFIKFVSMRSHKSRGTDIEKRLMHRNPGWGPRKDLNSGDLVNELGESVEVKSSIISPNKEKITLRSISTKKQFDWYVVVILDVSQIAQVDHKIYKFKKSEFDSLNRLATYSGSETELGVTIDNNPREWDKFLVHDINF